MRAVGLTAHLATVLIGSDGRPSTQAMLWRDNRAWREAQELYALLGPELESVTGRPVSPESRSRGYACSARRSPGARPDRWLLSLKDYLTFQLTGIPCTDRATASYTQLFDAAAALVCADRHGMRCAHGDPSSVRSGVALAGRVTPASAKLTGLVPGIPVAVGGPDGSTGALGVGAVRPGLTVDIAGTTDVLLHVTDMPAIQVSGGAVLNAYLLDGLWTVGGPTGLTGGGLTWLAATLGHELADAAYRVLEPALDAADPGELMIRTTLTGRRLPGWDARVRGRIDGISGEHGPARTRCAPPRRAVHSRCGLASTPSGSTGAEVSHVILALAARPSHRARHN